MSVIEKTIVLVGDGTSGKTSLITLFTEARFPTTHTYLLYGTWEADLDLDNQRVKLTIRETPGQELYDSLSNMFYTRINIDVFVIFFIVSDQCTLEHVESKWIKVLRKHHPNVPVILVGNKTDLRDDPISESSIIPWGGLQQMVTKEMGMKAAKRIKAHCYLECSGFKNQGVQEVFMTAAKVAISNDKKIRKKNLCVFL